MIDYTKIVNQDVLNLADSGIRKYFDLAAGMNEVISLGVGEPDFLTPWHIRQAGIRAIESGMTRYTDNLGMLELREAIAAYLKRRFALTYRAKDEIMVTIGGSEAIDMALRVLIAPGDEILIPEPCYVCYNPITKLGRGRVVPLKTTAKDKFKITPELLKAAITDRTKLLIMSYPNNPTGAIMDSEDLQAIVPLLIEHNIMVVSDEIYAELNYTDKRHVSIAAFPGMKERTMLIGGFSKTYSMTGWRLGYLCAPTALINELIKIHQYAIMSASTISQYAGIEALNHGDEDIRRVRDEYNARRRFITNGFNKLGLACFEPEGAFYVFPCIKSTGLSSDEFCEKLLNDQHVAVVPGTAFGDSGEGYVRVSYCYSVNHIKEALKRIGEFSRNHRDY